MCPLDNARTAGISTFTFVGYFFLCRKSWGGVGWDSGMSIGRVLEPRVTKDQDQARGSLLVQFNLVGLV